MTEADRLWLVRADKIIRTGSAAGVATICLDCEGVLHRYAGVHDTRGWVPRYCECSAVTVTWEQDFAAHGLTAEGAGGRQPFLGRVAD